MATSDIDELLIWMRCREASLCAAGAETSANGWAKRIAAVEELRKRPLPFNPATDVIPEKPFVVTEDAMKEALGEA